MTAFTVIAITGACLAAIGYTFLAEEHFRRALVYRRGRRQWKHHIRDLEQQLALADEVHLVELGEQADEHRLQLEEREADHLAALQRLDDQLGEMTGLYTSSQTRVRELELELEREKQENRALHDQLEEVRGDWTIGVRRVLSRSQAHG